MTAPFDEQRLAPGGMLNAELTSKAVAEFGSDGAWLLLSIVWYGWRAHYDLCTALMSGRRPDLGDDPRPTAIGTEFDVVRDLQVQASLFAVAEQFATLLRAALMHERGTDKFFDSYVRAPAQLKDLVDGLRGVDRDQVVALLGEPPELVAPDLGLLNPGSVAVTDVGGLAVPTSILAHHAERNLVAGGHEVLDMIVKNARELAQFVDTGGPPFRSLRDVDNAFRHGLRVLFHECVPEERRFRALGIGPEMGAVPMADLYMPIRGKGNGDLANFATVVSSRERTVGHLRMMRELSIRSGQLARGFLGYNALGDARWLLAASSLGLPTPAT